ncbi:AGE family epimerase/isomerase [Algibacillus agarilyticus]|uniref:AGE family epimerase/isomerase n=1 Tax=Algibacillus agarilyticus TaxID=2234133 RepID=UPI0013002C31|nr:AGE family epimerase/isomerase [Algibacillus agarilyticus]
MPEFKNLNDAATHFVSWLSEHALPLWASNGLDTKTGGSFEKLNSQGQPDTQCDRRVRVNYRQMFVYAMANEKGWFDNGERVVDSLQTFINTHAKNDKGQFAHLLNANCQIIDSKQDTYDLAFYLLACAWRYRAFNDQSALTAADAMMEHIDTHIKGIKGGWFEGDFNSNLRRQNPHMHLFETFMALYSATKNAKWLARAGEVFTLFQTHFFDEDKGVLLEYFNADWSPQFGTHGKIIEAGHMLEWVWLLHEYQQLTGSPVTQYTDILYKNAIAYGSDVTGLLFDECNEKGQIIKATKRCWPITELLKASVAQANAESDPYIKALYEQKAQDAIELLFKYYLTGDVLGTYCDQLDENNNVIVAESPASTLYHLVVAANEAITYCKSRR